jgi:hypothetical protein
MVEALDDALAQEPTRRAAAPPPPAPPPTDRHIPPKVLAGAAALIAGAAIAFFALSGGDGGNGDRVAAQTGTHGTAASKTKTHKANAKAKPRTVTRVVTQTAPPPTTTAQTTQATPPADTTATTTAPATTDPAALQAQGHELIAAGDPNSAIPILQQAVADCPVSQTDPCAYAYYDLGHALRLAGRASEAIPVLETRLQNPDQRGTVMAELRQAQHEAG